MHFEIFLNQKGQDQLTATKHQHDNTIEIIQIINGNGNLLIGKHIYEFQSGDVFVFDASALHCTTPALPKEYVRNKLIIEKQILLQLTDKIRSNVYFRAGKEISALLCTLFESAHKAHYIQKSDILAVSELLKIFHICYRSENSISPLKNGIAFTIMNYVNNNLSDDNCLDRLAGEVHLSKFHMCRKFKAETGITVYSYIKSQKLSLAKKLLAENDLSISFIACEAGFADVSCFTKAFKKETGVTPSLFRKNMIK